MTDLADRVLPLIRTRADVYRWSTANAHGRQMHDAVDLLAAAAEAEDAAVVFSVTQQAIGSAIKVILRADDSSGIIGDAVRRLLTLHAELAIRARPPTSKLVAWMIKFQFDGEQDFFQLDPVAYAPALGDKGVARYRAQLDEIAAGLGPEPTDDQRWSAPDSMTRFALEWNHRRLAVLDRDIDAIIRTHARDRSVAAWLQNTAEALEEIGAIPLAIDWARQATELGPGHQSARAADYWCRLLDEHRPDELLAARLQVFRRWPSSTTAGQLHATAGNNWPDYREEVFTALATRPRDAVLFALLTLRDVPLAWTLAHSLDLQDHDVWDRLTKAYAAIDPLAVLPVLTSLVEQELQAADARQYRVAAKRLQTMRRLAAGTDQAAEVDALVAELRETHRRRPRLQQEFDRAGLP